MIADSLIGIAIVWGTVYLAIAVAGTFMATVVTLFRCVYLFIVRLMSGTRPRFPDWRCDCPSYRNNLVFGSKDRCTKCDARRPALPTGVRAPVPSSSAEWICGTCNTPISNLLANCPTCAAAQLAKKPVVPYERRAGDWDCTACGKEFIFARNPVCPQCAKPKPTLDVLAVEGKETCVVCLDNKPIMMAEPCCHRHYCAACAEQMRAKPCATCRVLIATFKRVYD